MLTVHHLPDLRQPAVICAVSGWSDAGSSASGALSYLLGKWSSRRFADFDSDAIYNYTVTRPATIRPGGGRRRLHWPELAWYSLPVPHAQRDLVLLLVVDVTSLAAFYVLCADYSAERKRGGQQRRDGCRALCQAVEGARMAAC